jgi:hypothetical protein
MSAALTITQAVELAVTGQEMSQLWAQAVMAVEHQLQVQILSQETLELPTRAVEHRAEQEHLLLLLLVVLELLLSVT